MNVIEQLKQDVNFYKEAYKTAMDIVKVVQNENKELKESLNKLIDMVESNF